MLFRSLVALLAARGVACLRVHDVRATRDALAVVAAMGLMEEPATPGWPSDTVPGRPGEEEER